MVYILFFHYVHSVYFCTFKFIINTEKSAVYRLDFLRVREKFAHTLQKAIEKILNLIEQTIRRNNAPRKLPIRFLGQFFLSVSHESILPSGESDDSSQIPRTTTYPIQVDVSRLGILRNVRKREGNCRAATNVRQFQRRRGHRASRNARFSANFNQRHQPRSFRRKRHERTLVKSNGGFLDDFSRKNRGTSYIELCA